MEIVVVKTHDLVQDIQLIEFDDGAKLYKAVAGVNHYESILITAEGQRFLCQRLCSPKKSVMISQTDYDKYVDDGGRWQKLERPCPWLDVYVLHKNSAPKAIMSDSELIDWIVVNGGIRTERRNRALKYRHVVGTYGHDEAPPLPVIEVTIQKLRSGINPYCNEDPAMPDDMSSWIWIFKEGRYKAPSES